MGSERNIADGGVQEEEARSKAAKSGDEGVGGGKQQKPRSRYHLQTQLIVIITALP